MTTVEKVTNKYLNALKHLPAGKEKNAEYRSYIRNSIAEVFAADHNAGEAEVGELLGEPETVRNSYIQRLSDGDLAQGRRERRKRNIRLAALILPICLIICAICAFYISHRWFPDTRVLISRPVDRNAEKYIEFPTLATPGSSLVQPSAQSVLRERVFIDNVSMAYQQLWDKYPEKCHIICTVASDKNGTTVVWTGTGVTPVGDSEDVYREYVCEYRFKVDDSGDAVNDRTTRAQELTEQMLAG